MSPFSKAYTIIQYRKRYGLIDTERGKDVKTADRVVTAGAARVDNAEIVAVVVVRAAEPPQPVG